MAAIAPPAFLDRLDPEARNLLLSVARQVSFMQGSQLVRHGEPARGAWLLREGAAEAVVVLPGGERLTVALLGPGSMFGETALLDHGECTATVCASLNLDGWFVEREDFRALVAQRSPAALRIQHALTLALSEKLRILNARVLAWDAPEDQPARVEDPTLDPLAGTARLRHAAFDWRAFLHRLPLFEGFDTAEVGAVADEGRLIELARGVPVFVAGQKADAAYIVVRGAVEVIARRERMERRIAMLGPGQFFGFMSMLESLPHGASAYAREASLLLELDRLHFDAIYSSPGSIAGKLHRAIHRGLLASLAQTNRRLTRLISQAQLASGGERHAELSAAYHGQIVTGV